VHFSAGSLELYYGFEWKDAYAQMTSGMLNRSDEECIKSHFM